MIIEKIKYTAQYEAGRKIAEWIGIEGSPGFEETNDQTFQLIQDQVAKWHQQSNPENVIPTQQGPRGELPTINRAVERLLELIEDAQTLDQLAKYEADAFKGNIQELMAAFFRKRGELIDAKTTK